MTNKNELIEVIESANARGAGVKSIRKQKCAPDAFYMTLVDGKQVGPVKVTGNTEELTRKYDEAVSHLTALKTTPVKPPRKAA